MNKNKLLISKRTRLLLLGIILGAVGGWLYWDQIGCVDGCLITGNWFVAIPYGGMMGGLLMSILIPFLIKTPVDGRK